MQANETAGQAAGHGTIDVVTLAEKLRKIQPDVYSLLADLIASASTCWVGLLMNSSGDWRRPDSIAVGVIIFGFGLYVRFIQRLFFRLQLGRILRECKEK